MVIPYSEDMHVIFSVALDSINMNHNALTSLDTAISMVNTAIGLLESTPKSELIESPKAFISHGKNPNALKKLCDFLESLNIQPLVVEEEFSIDQGVSSKVNSCLKQSDFVIILATCDDEIKGKWYPRQNVIHEIGLAQNTHPGKIIYLLEFNVNLPSNVAEKVYTRFTIQSMDRAFTAIARELTALGILKAVKPQE